MPHTWSGKRDATPCHTPNAWHHWAPMPKLGDSIMDMQDGYEDEDMEAEGGTMWDAMVSQVIYG